MRIGLGLAAAAVIVVGCGGARNDPSADASAATGIARPSPSAVPSGEFAAEIVAVDPVALKVTLRESTATTTVSVGISAAGSLRDYRAGDRVVVSCRRGGSGTGPGTLASCTSVTAIRKAS